MKVSVSNKAILSLAAPISFSLLIPQVSFLANTAFLGRLGERELGVNGITGIFYLTLSMIGYGLSNGVQVQLARRAGEEDREGFAKIFTNGIMLSLFFALSLMVLSLWAAPLIFGFSLYNAENIYLSIDFLYIRIWGLPFLVLTQLCNSFFITIGSSRFLIYGSIAGTFTNILFDYLLIFGNGGFPAWGLEGAAVASVLGEIVFCAIMFGSYFAKKFHLLYPVNLYSHFDVKLCRKMLKVASPLIIQFLFGIGGWQVFFIFIEHLGTMELAASQILRSIFGIVGVGTWAFAATCNTMVSNIIGQGKPSQVFLLVRKIGTLSFVFAAIMCVLLLSFSEEFLALYRDDEALIALAVPSLRVIVVATLIMSISTVLFNAVVGTGNTWTNLAIEVTCVCCYITYCYIVIERNRMPLNWAWGSEFVYWGTLLITSFIYLKSGRWKGKRI